MRDYHGAIAAFNAAEPNDLGSHLEDLSGALEESLERLALLDELPAAFAAALRELDRSSTVTSGRPARVLSVDDPAAFRRAVAEHLLLAGMPTPGGDDLLDDLRRAGQWVDEQRNRLSKLGEWFENLPEAVDVAVEYVTTTLRRTVIVVEEITDNAWRQTVVAVDELERVVREWSVSFDLSALRRAAPFLKKLGLLGDAAAGGFAAWEQWDQDAGEIDVTSTERVLRAGVDGLARGSMQFGISLASGALAAPFLVAVPVTGGLSLIPAGAIIAGGVAFGEWVDPRLGEALDWAYENDPGILDWSADRIDDAGRGIRDAGEWGEGEIQDWNDWFDDIGEWESDEWPF